jgi:voltage-gated potassium channel Kch
MLLDIPRLLAEPLFVLSLAVGLMVLKTSIIAALAKLSGSPAHDALRLGVMLSQGGEFAFVVMTQALSSGVINPELADLVSLVVGVSMALTSPLLGIYNAVLARRKSQAEPEYDSNWESETPEVVIAGFGRAGQITGRILAANNIAFTALDRNAEHIEFVARYGNKVFFGDATRLDLLETAGIRHAKVLLVAVDDPTEALKIIELARHECPHLKIISRAHNRVGLLQQRKAGADSARRELLGSSINMAVDVMQGMGWTQEKAERTAEIFLEHDRGLIDQALQRPIERDSLIEIGVRGRAELQQLFEQDRRGDL